MRSGNLAVPIRLHSYAEANTSPGCFVRIFLRGVAQLIEEQPVQLARPTNEFQQEQLIEAGPGREIERIQKLRR